MKKQKVKLFVLGLFSCITLFFCAYGQLSMRALAVGSTAMREAGSQSSVDGSNGFDGSDGTQEKPAEEVYKNIKVFKGTPSSKLFNLMFYMEGSLGVSCNHCHVNFSDFASDGNPKKGTARRMIEMVRDLNAKNFSGRNEVSCNTCHRGQTKPAAPLSMAAIVEPKSAGGIDAKKADQPTPTVDQIFERYILSTGGRSVQEKLTDRVLNGSMFSSEGWKAPLKIFKKSPDKYLVTFDLTKWSSFNTFDGLNGWSQDNNGVRDLKDQGLPILRREGAFFSALELKSLYSNLTFVGMESINSRDVYVVAGDLAGAGFEKLYFDVETGFLVRVTSETETLLGVLPRQTEVLDYKKVDGITIPFTVVRSAPDFSSAYHIEKVSFRVAVPDSRFNKPDNPLSSIQK